VTAKAIFFTGIVMSKFNFCRSLFHFKNLCVTAVTVESFAGMKLTRKRNFPHIAFSKLDGLP